MAVEQLSRFRGGRPDGNGDDSSQEGMPNALSPVRSESAVSASDRVLSISDHEILQAINLHASTPPRLYPSLEDPHLRFSTRD